MRAAERAHHERAGEWMRAWESGQVGSGAAAGADVGVVAYAYKPRPLCVVIRGWERVRARGRGVRAPETSCVHLCLLLPFFFYLSPLQNKRAARGRRELGLDGNNNVYGPGT